MRGFWLQGRRGRAHPDDKVVAAWNALMISALAQAAVAPAESLDDRRLAYLAAARRSADFVPEELLGTAGGLPGDRGCAAVRSRVRDLPRTARSWCERLDMYEATFDVGWSVRAEELQGVMDRNFWDAEKGGYFNSAAGAPDVVVRLKEDYDGAEPAASSSAAINLFRLSSLNGDESLRERGRRTIAAFRGRWEEAPHAMPQLLCAFEHALEPPRHVVLTGNPASPEFAALAAVVHGRLGPRRVLIALDAPGARDWFASRLTWLAAMGAADGVPTAYVCEEFVCRAPAHSQAELRKALGYPGAES